MSNRDNSETDASDRPESRKPQRRLRGHVDGVLDGKSIVGWAFDPAIPETPITIRILEGDDLIVSGTANRNRVDVRASGVGNGLCGFHLLLPDKLFDNGNHLLDVYGGATADSDSFLGRLNVRLPKQGHAEQSNQTRYQSEMFDEFDTNEAFLTRARIETLESNLATALTRIDELDYSNRLLSNEREELRGRLNLLSERFSRDLTEIGASAHQASERYAENILETLSITQRRDLWLTQLSILKAEGPIFSTFPHGGESGKLCLLVWGSGGIGDMLYLSTVVRELYLQFSNCNIFVLNENPHVHDVFSNNPYVSGTIWLEAKALYDFIKLAHSLDIFDLVAEVKYCITYTRPPLSRIPLDFVRLSNCRSAEWQKYVRYRWPHLNNFFANAVVAQGINKLDLVGITSLLPIDRNSLVDMFFDYTDIKAAAALNNSAYVTIHHGADKKMSASGGRQTKNLPTSTWNAVVPLIHAAGYKVVQLGESHEDKIEGIDVDLRGRTALRETAQILKMAQAHLDTEGGLVHLARTVQTRSVVAFGPTPIDFFGYPQNENIAPPVCGNCWWVKDNWATECPRGLRSPECMTEHSSVVLADKAIEIAQDRQSFEITRTAVMAESSLAKAVTQLVDSLAGGPTGGAVFLGSEAAIEAVLQVNQIGIHRQCFVPAKFFQVAENRISGRSSILPYSSGNVPCASNSLDWAILVDVDPADVGFLPLCVECARCVHDDGKVVVLTLPAAADALVKMLEAGPTALAGRYLGNRSGLTWASEIAEAVQDRQASSTISFEIEAKDSTVTENFRSEASPVIDLTEAGSLLGKLG
jgi:ADP-heptose:LPS heptosyltransferase